MFRVCLAAIAALVLSGGIANAAIVSFEVSGTVDYKWSSGYNPGANPLTDTFSIVFSFDSGSAPTSGPTRQTPSPGNQRALEKSFYNFSNVQGHFGISTLSQDTITGDGRANGLGVWRYYDVDDPDAPAPGRLFIIIGGQDMPTSAGQLTTGHLQFEFLSGQSDTFATTNLPTTEQLLDLTNLGGFTTLYEGDKSVGSMRINKDTASLRIMNMVPEPSTWALMILAFVGLAIRAQRNGSIRRSRAAHLA